MQKKFYIENDRKNKEYVILTDEASVAIECSEQQQPCKEGLL